MKYDFSKIEEKWQKFWAEKGTFKAENNSEKEKFYVLDMFPYPSGAGLHVGHPLGYIASDIYARYKRHKGFNVLHPMGYDSFGLPAEQYAIQTGQHPAITTGENIKTYRRQLDQLGFSFDWSREIRTSDPKYYKWTQWIFIQLFNSWYNTDSDKAEPIESLISIFEEDGNADVKAVCDDDTPNFLEDDWQAFSSKEKQKILLKYRLTYLADADVNWCPALGTVLANDEIVNGVSERGGHPVVRKKMTQWMMRITAYAQRLLDGLDKIDWPQPLKDSQTNWIGRSEGASVSFRVLPLAPSEGGGTPSSQDGNSSRADGQSARVLPLAPFGGGGIPSSQDGSSSRADGPSAFDEERVASRLTGDSSIIGTLLSRAKEMRKNPTKAEAKLWEVLRKGDFVYKFRRQHPIYKYIVDFVCLDKGLIIEVDGEIHQHQLDKDAERQLQLEAKKGFKVLRFSNEEVFKDIQSVKNRIREELDRLPLIKDINKDAASIVSEGRTETKGNSLPPGEGWGGDLSIEVFTTRPDTIFGTSFMTLAPEHELVAKITTPEQKADVEAYIEATAKRSERDRMADVKTITGAFTGAYAEHPFTKEPIPIWIGDYVLAGYGTGAVMSVPCGDQRDYDFAKHFGIDIPNIFEGIDISEEAFADKEKTVITNSDFLNGLPCKKAVKKAIAELENLGQGKGKINYRLRDAVFSRQRYWGEPFPVYYDEEGMPQMLEEKFLPLKLPEVDKYLPTETGEPPLGNAKEWYWLRNGDEGNVVSKEEFDKAMAVSKPSTSVAERSPGTSVAERSRSHGGPLELNTMPGWAGSSQYFNRYMDPHNDDEIFSQEAINYWQDVDLYIGGSEHATGHLLYSRFWQKFMFDKGLVPVDEYAKKLINQGMITGTSAFLYRWDYVIKENKNAQKKNVFISQKLVNKMLSKAMFLEDVFENYEILRNLIIDFHAKDRDEKGFITISDSPSSISKIHADVSLVNSSDELDIEAFKNWRPEYKDAIFILEDGKIHKGNSLPSGEGRGGDFVVSREVEKMSKSKYNVVNPDAICEEYGADSLRMYEMFLGPLEQSKPWNTAGITGVHGFLKKLWKLYHSAPNGEFKVTGASLPTGGEQLKGSSPSPGGGWGEDHEPSAEISQQKTETNSPSSASDEPKREEGTGRGEDSLAESLKTLHKTIKKVEEDIETFSFNTSVSTFMICVNELTAQKCTSREILEPLAIIVSPYAPHIAEELWEKLGHTESIATATFPKFEEKYLVESSKEYPISFNGKMRFTMELPLDLDKQQIEEAVMAHEKTQQQLDGRTPKKVIVVPGKIVNIVG